MCTLGRYLATEPPAWPSLLSAFHTAGVLPRLGACTTPPFPAGTLFFFNLPMVSERNRGREIPQLHSATRDAFPGHGAPMWWPEALLKRSIHYRMNCPQSLSRFSVYVFMRHKRCYSSALASMELLSVYGVPGWCQSWSPGLTHSKMCALPTEPPHWPPENRTVL